MADGGSLVGAIRRADVPDDLAGDAVLGELADAAVARVGPGEPVARVLELLDADGGERLPVVAEDGGLVGLVCFNRARGVYGVDGAERGRRSPGTGPPASPTVSPASAASRSVPGTPRRAPSRSSAAPASTAYCHGSDSPVASGIAEPRIAPIAAGPAPSRKPRTRASPRRRSKAARRAARTRTTGAKATAAASSAPPTPPAA